MPIEPTPALWPPLVAAFALSLLGGLHCAAMCGGFVGALHAPRVGNGKSSASRTAGYHAGRITSYVLAGTLAGALGGSLFAARVLPLQVALLVAGSLMLLAIGLSMFGRNAWLRRLEPLGIHVWKLVAPVARRLYPPRSGAHAYLAGLAWGWIPCGMVYAALPLALSTGNALHGAAVMLAFGAGTLPNLLALGHVASRLARLEAATPPALATLRTALRPAAGVVLLGFGASTMAHAALVAGANHPAIAVLASICHG